MRAVLLGALVALPLLIFGTVAWYDYLDEVRDARQSALRSAYSLAEHADSVFNSIDLALKQVDRVLGARGAVDTRGDGDFHQVLQDLTRRMPPVESIFLVDEGGVIAASSRAFPMAPYDVQHREYFLAAKAGQDGLFVSVPFRGEFARSVAFTASRPVIRNGVFRGLVAVTVFPEYFHSLYRSTFLMEQTGEPTALLLRRDGTVIFRSPDQRGSDPLLVSSDLVTQANSLNTGLLLGAGTIDGRSDITAFRSLPSAPLTFVYAVRQADLTADWYRRLAGYGLMMACVSGVLATGGALLLFGPPGIEEGALAPSPPRIGEGALQPRLRGAVTVLDAARANLGLVRRMADDPSVGGGVDARALVEGASFGIDEAQRLLSGRGGRLEGRIVNVRISLRDLRLLLMGSVWPHLEISEPAEGPEPLDIFVDPGAFDLALLDLALGLWEHVAPGARVTVHARPRVVRIDEAAPVAPGDYAVITFTLLVEHEGEGPVRQSAEARLRQAASFAQSCEGHLELEYEGPRIARASLFLPAALVSEQPART
ncbi:MAG: cache domain-containing protein [Pseudomonadota bacterium]